MAALNAEPPGRVGKSERGRDAGCPERAPQHDRPSRQRDFSRRRAYAICSVAVDIKVSQLVDVPSFLVSASLPEGIFTT